MSALVLYPSLAVLDRLLGLRREGEREGREFYLLGLHPVVPVPSSCMFETPIMIAPASRSFLATVASSVSGSVPRYTVPTR